VGTRELRHVLDAAEDGHVGRAQHVHRLSSVQVGDVLRPDDDERTAQTDEVDQLLSEVCRSGRRVDDEEVERAPRYVVKKLPKRAVDQRRRQRERLGLADQEADGHELQPVALDRLVSDRASLGRRPTEQPALTDL